MNRTNAIALAGLFAVFTVVVALISATVPLIGIPLLAVIPVFSAVLCIKTDIRFALMSGVAALLLLSFLTDPITAAFFLPGIVAGMATGFGIQKRFSPIRCVVISVAASLVTLAALFAAVSGLTDFNVSQLRPTLIQVFDEVLASPQFAPMLESDVSLRSNLIDYIDSMLALLPSAIISSQTFLGFIAFYLTTTIARRIGMPTGYPPFRDLIFPRHVSMTIAGMILVTMVLAQFQWISVEMSSNLQLIFLSPFIVAGCSVISGLLYRKLPTVLITVLLGLALLFFAYPLLMLGLIDTIFDFRKVRARYGQ
ncbi:MAG: DUF2232 domain-containing protein [Bacillota bacterium]|nr:DUF2232 domain-containing protein [Bacillota bacterium]